MALETATPASRRALLTAGLGGLAAVIAGALGRPTATRAANGDPVLVGESHTATNPTQITNTTSGSYSFWGTTASGVGVYGTATSSGIGVSAISSSGTGVWGESASSGTGVRALSDSGNGVHATSTSGTSVRAESTSGFGVLGSSNSYIGVHGTSPAGTGVHGYSGSSNAVSGDSEATDRPAILGHAFGGNTGILGVSDPGDAPATPSKTGVYGYAVQAANSRGVYGQTTIGRGVEGRATSGFGMFAQATTGQALQAGATTGTGVYAFADTNGTALRAARGHVKFSTAGLATIAAGSDSVTVTPGFDISTSSKVLAVLQGDPGGTTVLRYVARDAAGDAFTIRLSANAAGATPVAWFVIS